MTLLSWAIVIIPLCFVMFVGFYSRRYVRDIADYLACGRVAGRYVICVGDLTAGLSVITLVALCEQNYQCGMAMGFWNAVNTPLAVFISLTGYCVYRFRQTRCLSMGQFLEQRYSRTFRIVAATVRTLAEMVTNAIGPAVAVRFFIYFIGLPHKFNILGFEVSTYGILVVLLLTLALGIVWPGGRIALLLTDSMQGIMSYPIFVIFTVWVLTQISWFGDVVPVMLDRAHGESFLNPMDLSELRDFNFFALIVTMIATVLNRAAWIGNDTTSSGRTAHEQKMANILGTWRNGFSYTMMTMISIFVIVFMLGSRFADQAHEVRVDLTKKIITEVVESPMTQSKIIANVSVLPVAKHVIDVDPGYSRKLNPDTPFMDVTKNTLKSEMALESDANETFQKYRSLYNQMIMPILLGKLFPPVLMGLFALLMVMLLLSTDDSRIFNASSTIIQDIIVPLKSKAMTTKEHLLYLKLCSLGVTIFFFVVSMFFAQLDYINMFVTIMCAVWLGAAGPIMVGGLYTRFGTTFGAWCALFFGSGLSVLGLILQRNWAKTVYPWLESHDYVNPVAQFLQTVSAPLNPYIEWSMDPVKFPINSMEIYFMAMMLGIGGYIIGSIITYKEPYNLDRLFHRGIYSDGDSVPEEKMVWNFSSIVSKLVGISPEYTKGDKIIAWSVFVWSIVYGFVIMFCCVLVWNAVSGWQPAYWGMYFFISTVVAALVVGAVSTVWFMYGGIKDSFAMVRDLEKRISNPLDNGRVEGHVSLADKAHFDEIEHEIEEEHKHHDDQAKK